MNKIETATISVKTLEVRFGDGKTLLFEDCWLRDNCRCSACYNADTYQRALHILDLPDSRVKTVSSDGTQVHLTWDDGHKTVYESTFLRQYDYKTWWEAKRFKPKLWYGSKLADKVAKIHVDNFLNTADGAIDVFKSLLDYGVVLIEGVGVSTEATEAVCKALGGVQHTLFGGMWTFSSSPDHADTAYTNLPLAPHNDNTYFTEAAGLQVFQCLEHSNGTGGETVLVDGFYGAKLLDEEYPLDFEFLTTFKLDAEYIETGHHHKYSAPVIQVDPKTQDFKQIRFNTYDRATMAFANGEQCRSYYRSLRNLAKFYQDPKNQFQFKLKPGTVLAIDNFRVLHGRTSFTGKRIMCGSYVARSDWLDKARTLGLIQ